MAASRYSDMFQSVWIIDRDCTYSSCNRINKVCVFRCFHKII